MCPVLTTFEAHDANVRRESLEGSPFLEIVAFNLSKDAVQQKALTFLGALDFQIRLETGNRG